MQLPNPTRQPSSIPDSLHSPPRPIDLHSNSNSNQETYKTDPEGRLVFDVLRQVG
jgi:hypothetical protein